MRPSRTISNVVWVLCTNRGVDSINMVRGIILARLLHPEDFGIVASALMFENILQNFSSMGIGSAAVYLQEEPSRVLPVALMMKTVFCCILAAIVFFSAPLWGSFFGRSEVASVTRFAATLFLVEILLFPSRLQAQLTLRFKDLSIPRLGAALVGCVTAASLALSGSTYWSIIGGILAARLAEAGLLFRAFPWEVRFTWDGSLALELWRYGRHVVAASILITLILQVDNLLVGKLLGLTALGYYVHAFRWAEFTSKQISSAIGSVLFPTFSHWRVTDNNLLQKFELTMQMSAILSFPAAIGLLAIAPEFVQIMLGERWLPTVIPLQVLCVAGVFRSAGNPIDKLLQALGYPALQVKYNVGYLLTLVCLLVPLSLWSGIVGASVAVLIATLGWYFLARVVALRRLTGLSFGTVGRALMPALVASAFMGMGVFAVRALYATSATSPGFLVFLVVLGGTLYGISIFAFYGRELRAAFHPSRLLKNTFSG